MLLPVGRIINKFLSRLNIKVQYLDKSKLICNNQKQVCNIFNKDNNKFHIFDGSHWTLEGAKFFGEKIDFSIF